MVLYFFSQAFACPGGFLPARAGHPLVGVMVVAARLRWLKLEVERGVPAHVVFCAAEATDRAKVKVVLDHRAARCPHAASATSPAL